jgi:ribonuclease P protein subunit RPR2
MAIKKSDKKQNKLIAKNRIIKLFLLAHKKALYGDINLANRYVHLARKISMRYLVKIPNEFKRRFCKHCYSYLLPDINSRIRVHRGKIIIFCNNCNKYTRIPIKKSTNRTSARLK